MSKTRKIVLTVVTALSFVLIVLVIYVCYVMFSYYRIEDNLKLNILNNQEDIVELNNEYKISTYNIGFGAYSQDFSFFMDKGYLENGKKVTGKGSKAKNKETVINNTNGVIDTVKSINPDFMFFQEVDTKSNRSKKVNQYNMMNIAFDNYTNVYANNFHSPFLMYPIFKPHGKVNSGISTYSKFKMDESIRKSFTVTTALFSKLFDLDRCFNASFVPINGSDKYLVLINLHMSAFDKGGVIRAEQMKEINSFMNEMVDQGNYVIAGGDFNHDLLTNNPNFEYTLDNLPFNNQFKQPTPDWLSFLFDENKEMPIDSKFRIVASDNIPSCRTTDIEWKPGYTYQCVVDGFIVSSNIEVISHMNIETEINGVKGFAYSDHQPATMTFKLK